MSEKKQYPYRYNEESEKLFEIGIEMYKKESPTPKFSMNQLLDICLNKAIVAYPKQIQAMKTEINKLNRQLQEAESEKAQLISELKAMKDKVRLKFQIDSDLSKMVNFKQS